MEDTPNGKSVRDRLFADARPWQPHKKDSSDPDFLEGVVVEVETWDSEYARPGDDPSVPAVQLLTDDGELWRVVGYGTALKGKLARCARAGARIAVGYAGLKESNAGRSYNDFRVLVVDPGPGGPPEPAPGPAAQRAPQPGDGPLPDEEPF